MRPPRPIRLCLFLLPISYVMQAQLAPIGLSEVHGQWFDNEDLLFYGPDTDDHFAAALATGDFKGAARLLAARPTR